MRVLRDAQLVILGLAVMVAVVAVPTAVILLVNAVGGWAGITVLVGVMVGLFVLTFAYLIGLMLTEWRAGRL